MKKRVILSLLTVLLTFGLMAQKQKKYDYGPDSANCVMNISLYEGYYEQKMYDDAMSSWRKCVEICPKSRKSLYINGAKMYTHYIKLEKDSLQKLLLVDTLLSLYDKRIEHFAERGKVLAYKGATHFNYFRDIDPYASYLILKESVDLLKEKSQASILSKVYQAMYKSYRDDKVEKADMYNEYIVIGDYISKAIQTTKSEKKREKYESARNNLDEFFIKFAKCEDIVSIFSEKVTADPSDFELKKKALKVMNRRNCDDSDFYLKMAEAVYSKEPSCESAYAIAIMKAKRKDVSAAMTYFDESIKLCEGTTDIVNVYIKAGMTAIANNQTSKARSYANKALELEPNNGNAIIIIGDAISYGACDDGKAGIYAKAWLAADYYARARAKDPSVAEKASSRLRSCTSRYPETAQIFMLGIKEGDSYTHCNGETTTVRLKK